MSDHANDDTTPRAQDGDDAPRADDTAQPLSDESLEDVAGGWSGGGWKPTPTFPEPPEWSA